jgi:hypothetical protein
VLEQRASQPERLLSWGAIKPGGRFAPDARLLQLGPDLVQPLDDGCDLALVLDIWLPLGVYRHLDRRQPSHLDAG